MLLPYSNTFRQNVQLKLSSSSKRQAIDVRVLVLLKSQGNEKKDNYANFRL